MTQTLITSGSKMQKNDLIKVAWPFYAYKGKKTYNLNENEILVVLSSENIVRMNNMTDHKLTMYSSRIGTFEWSGNNITLCTYFEKIT